MGAPPSQPQLVTLSPSFTSRNTQMCGLRNSTFVTAPENVTGLFTS